MSSKFLKINNKDRFLLNDVSITCENQVNEILSNYPHDAQIDFVEPTLKDLLPININEIL